MAEEIRLKNGGEITPPRDGKKRHYWWRYLLCFVAGTLFPGILLGSAIAIGGTVVKTRDLMSMLGINADEYLSGEYQNSTVLEMVRSLSKKKFETLQDIYEVTPYIKKVIEEDINPKLQEFIHAEFTWEELKDLKFVPVGEDKSIELLTYFQTELPKKVTLASFIDGAESSEGLIRVFLYGKDEEDVEYAYTLDDFMHGGDDFFNTILSSVTVKDLVPNLDIKLADMTLADFQNLTLDTLHIDDIINVYYHDSVPEGKTESEPILQKLGPVSIATLSSGNIMSVIGDLRIDELITVKYTGDVPPEEESEAILQKLGPVTINELSEGNIYGIVKTMRIDELLPIKYAGDVPPEEESNAILQKIGPLSIDELATSDLYETIKTMTIKSLFPPSASSAILDMFGDDFTIEDLTDSDKINSLSLNGFFKDVTDNVIITALFGDDENPTTIDNISDKINNLTIGQVLTIEPGSLLDNEQVKALKITEAGDILDVLTVEDLLGESNFTTALNNKSPNPKATLSEISDLMRLLTISDIVGESDNAFIKAIGDVYLFDDNLESTLVGNINGVSIGQLFGEDSTFTDDPIMSKIWPSIKDSTVETFPSALADAFKELKLVDMLGDQLYKTGSGAKSRNAIKVSYTLKDSDLTKSGDVITGVNPISDGALLGNSIYSALESQITSGLDVSEIAELGGSGVEFTLDKHSGNYYLNYVPVDVDYVDSADTTNMNYVYDAIKESTSEPTIDGTTLTFDRGGYTIKIEAYEAKEIDGSFWYLFTEKGEKFNSKNDGYIIKLGQTYTVDSDFNQMINNFKDHMQTEKIRDLVKAGFINEISDEKLNSPLTIQTALGPVQPDPTHNLGDYTLKQLFDLILNLSI